MMKLAVLQSSDTLVINIINQRREEQVPCCKHNAERCCRWIATRRGRSPIFGGVLCKSMTPRIKPDAASALGEIPS